MVIGGGNASFMWKRFERQRAALDARASTATATRRRSRSCTLTPPSLQRLVPKGFSATTAISPCITPKGAAMVNFGGTHKPHNCPIPWVQQAWAMIFAIDGLQIDLVETHDRNVLHLQDDGYERDSLVVWAKLVKPGAVALDIGAYTGLYSIIAAKRGAKVIALEPMPANRLASRRQHEAQQGQIGVLAVAASDHEGTATLHYNPNVPLTTGASLESGNAKHAAGIVVKCITIDSLGLENVGAIKIDVERHEPCVIRGAMQTIERYRPPMLVETLDGDMRNHILEMLPSYEAAAILDGRNTLVHAQVRGDCNAARSNRRNSVPEGQRQYARAQGQPHGLVIAG